MKQQIVACSEYAMQKRLSMRVSLNSEILRVFLYHRLSALMWSWELRGPAALTFQFPFSTFVLFMDLN